jgi:hypothetical protein
MQRLAFLLVLVVTQGLYAHHGGVDWTFDGPVNRITQRNDDIEILYGQLNLRRIVHMNLTTHPSTVKPTRAGHSIGRWEKDVLVVDTVKFLPGVLNAPVLNSDQLHVVDGSHSTRRPWR